VLRDDAFDALPGVIVREARLERFVEALDTVRLRGAEDRLRVTVLATSTVLLTGRGRVDLLRVDGAGAG
jgi:hypothetical protein